MLCQNDGSAFPVSGRQYDQAVTKTELHAIRAVYTIWLARWGVTNQRPQASASTMLHLIFATGSGFKLRPEEWRLLTAIDNAVIKRINP